MVMSVEEKRRRKWEYNRAYYAANLEKECER